MASKPAGKKPAPRKSAPKPAAPKKSAAGAAVPKLITLTEKQQRFVDEYLVDLNATQAAIRAGYSPATAGSIGHENLKKPEIQSAITAGRKLQQERTHIDADKVVLEAWRIAMGDARELVEVRVGCCRYCWGVGHKRQRTVVEYNQEREKWAVDGNSDAEWDDAGGIGYSPLKAPHATCPECWGDGSPRTVIRDTRNLSASAAALYAGAKDGKYGIEVQTHDKVAALEKLFKHTGAYEQDNKQKAEALAAMLPRVTVEFVKPPHREDDQEEADADAH